MIDTPLFGKLGLPEAGANELFKMGEEVRADLLPKTEKQTVALEIVLGGKIRINAAA